MVSHRKKGGPDPARHVEDTAIPTHRIPSWPGRIGLVDRLDRLAPLAGDDTLPTPLHAPQDRHLRQYQLRLVQYSFGLHLLMGSLGLR